MSNPAYKNFLQLKQNLKEENKGKYAERTLSYFGQLQEAVGRVEYESNHEYLQSVLDYIEENEYITPSQIDIVEKILNHPDEVCKFGDPF
jgi:hypothetical protein